MENLNDKFNHLFEIISRDSFLKMESLGGEIPFFIAAYDARQELDISRNVGYLKNKLETQGIPVLEINLYSLSCELLEERSLIDRLFRVERKKGKDKFLRALQSSLNIHEVLMPAIQAKIAEHGEAKVYFLTGIGQVFPFIRSHTILNNLQNIAKEAPTVTFFPGEYNGHSLNLFGKLKDDNYYRAFNIENIKA
ncbi:DUF1788 domain-containing protein [Robertkochia sediminum]|uniref:DUF1788 domain-containing protein n=1 Tax=Robertkochia sediminum TaxID=2785326 RepID=UPI001933AA86|nr:DUF1788 domain-containing protein [Robertkochia sediminum]MBL7471376.1 DUF1788 domain-containing protein [Robertkochia sediminum]